MSTEVRRIGKYELRRRLATGGQGEVWEAFDVQLRRPVAIKQLNAHLQADTESSARFEREARFIASLRHPNIVQIHDFLQLEGVSGSHTSTAYMVMDYIDGLTLADYIRNTSRKRVYPSASDIVTIFTAISLALDYAHQKGMVHRDIKPANIMLDRRNPRGKPMGEPILMDFGIAKLQGGATETTKVLGTPLYASPEQARGETGDKRSDLYSLGIILYEMMTGLTPFIGESIPAILMRHSQEAPLSPGLINPDISPEVSAVILKSIAKDPDARFSSASAMTRALAEVLNVPVPPELERNPGHLTLASSTQPVYFTSPLAFVPLAEDRQTPVTPVPLPSRKRPGKRLSLVLILVLAVLGLGLASYALFALHSGGGASPSSVVVGQVSILNSGRNTGGKLDEAVITLKGRGIPGGKNYCAWVESNNFNSYEGHAHWLFGVHGTKLDPPSHQDQDMLPPAPYRLSLFLITTPTQCDPSATTPPFPVEDHLYYANLAHMDNNHLTFDILPCPQSDNSSNPCLA